jgi:hypothetical protein
MNTPEAPATDGSLVRAVVAYANGAQVVLMQKSNELPSLVEQRARIRAGVDDRQREQFRALLERVLHDPKENGAELFPKAAQLLDGIKTKLTIHFGGRGFWITDTRSFADESRAMDFAVLLLLDRKKPYRKILARCHYGPCQIFYLAQKNPKGGPANRRYCSPEHRNESHNSTRAARRQKGRKEST